MSCVGRHQQVARSATASSDPREKPERSSDGCSGKGTFARSPTGRAKVPTLTRWTSALSADGHAEPSIRDEQDDDEPEQARAEAVRIFGLDLIQARANDRSHQSSEGLRGAVQPGDRALF